MCGCACLCARVCVWPLVEDGLPELAPAALGLRCRPRPGRGRPSWFVEVALEDGRTCMLRPGLLHGSRAAFVRFLGLCRPQPGHCGRGTGLLLGDTVRRGDNAEKAPSAGPGGEEPLIVEAAAMNSRDHGGSACSWTRPELSQAPSAT